MLASCLFLLSAGCAPFGAAPTPTSVTVRQAAPPAAAAPLAGPAALPLPAPGAGTGAGPGLGPVGRGVWPLDPVPPVVRPFEAPPQRWLPGHRGVDLGGWAGQTVRSAVAGTVEFAGTVAGKGVITVRLPNGWRTTYEPVTAQVPRGTVVAPGQRIATLAAGPSHCAPASCLHWGLLVADDDYRDPLILLGPRRVILLPPH